ncbi:MAG: hypothetical protein JSS49_19000 [Planctomycetes bacterium]|nr:hypothetical protein [Planctomycetota bacterium]
MPTRTRPAAKGRHSAAHHPGSSTRNPPTPMMGERQTAFFVRAMRALRHVMPSVNRRTLEVLRLWIDSANDRDLRDKSRAQFPASEFQYYAPRCVFLEHTIPASSDGERPGLHYGQDALQQMVDWANYRIRNSDTFSVISDGHTPTNAELATGRAMPDVLGYAGPFYLGQLGDLNPRWAIYAEEWVHRADVPQFEKLQRRSPEVWVTEPIDRRTMDPIAALGAETPRLDCGMNPYSRAGDGQQVMSYSAMTIDASHTDFARTVSTMPGADVTVPRIDVSPVPDRRSGTPSFSGESTMPLSPDSQSQNAGGFDLRMLEQAVMQSVTALIPSILQTVQQQLAGQDDDEPTTVDDMQDNSDDDDTLTSTTGQEVMDSLEIPDEELCQQYSAMSEDCQRAFRSGWKRGAAVSHRYARHTDLHKVVARQQVRLQELSDQIARERRDAARYSKLNELSREFAFDPREEAETCRDMSDKQFERHCTATIVKYARRDDVTNVELFTDSTVTVDRYGAGAPSRATLDQIERYSREAAAVAARKNAAKRGSTSFEVEFDAICKQHGLSV